MIYEKNEKNMRKNIKFMRLSHNFVYFCRVKIITNGYERTNHLN